MLLPVASFPLHWLEESTKGAMVLQVLQSHNTTVKKYTPVWNSHPYPTIYFLKFLGILTANSSPASYSRCKRIDHYTSNFSSPPVYLHPFQFQTRKYVIHYSTAMINIVKQQIKYHQPHKCFLIWTSCFAVNSCIKGHTEKMC